MNLRAFWKDENIFWEAVVLSLCLHFLLFHVGEISFRFHEKHTVEIDITNMGHMGMPGPVKQAAASSAPEPKKPTSPPREWTKHAPNQKAIPAPIPTQPVPAPEPEETPPPSPAATSNGTGEYGIGDGSASVLSRLPQLLNLSDLSVILKRFYPEQARTERREGTVVLDLHIDTDGHVQSADVVRSNGSDFDDAARRIAKLLRFTPAFMGSQRVAVKMRQAIQFKLKDE